jgi:6-phosphogluconolactonase (cycloisomerase 2 family)
MQQGPVPTQLCCETINLGGARLTRIRNGMKFKKIGKALVLCTLSMGVVLGITSCVQSYTVGYLYVTGTATASSSGTSGIISGYKIDHNTGKLSAIHGLPVSSGGANPVRAVLLSSSRFLYVLNRGTTASGGSDCTTADPCQNANITVFAVGGNGILTPQETFYPNGINPFRLLPDSSGSHIYVLDHDSAYNGSPSSASNPNPNCALALGQDSNGSDITTCGAIEVYSINGTTGRLSLVTNAQVTASTGSALPYFPVPSNAVDMLISSSYVLTLAATDSTASTSFPYTGGSLVFPYSLTSGTGQLKSTGMAYPWDSLGISAGTAIYAAGSNIYVLDNESITVDSVTSPSQILPFTVGSSGSLQSQTGGAVAEDSSVSNPIVLLLESKSKWIYVANQGNNASETNAQSGIDAFVLTSSPFQMSHMAGAPFGSGAGPVCMVEDPTSQFIYMANFNDSTVTGRVISRNDGELVDLNTTKSYSLSGPPSWCLVDGRTD